MQKVNRLNEENLSRVRGTVFVSEDFDVTQNKLTLVTDLQNAVEKFFVKITSLTPKIVTIAARDKPEEIFRKWLAACHARFDKEVGIDMLLSLKYCEAGIWRQTG
jgi:hypothetical protein